MIKFITGFLQSATNESLKRLIAFFFSVSLIVAYFFANDIGLKTKIVFSMVGLIALLLGLATAENIISIFQNKNNSENNK